MKTGNIRLLCGGRNNGKTLQQYLEIQKWAIENGYKKVKFEFVTPDIIEIQELVKYLKEQINQCKLIGNDEDYIKLDVYNEILSKIEKSDK